MSKSKYEWGEDKELDQARTSHNISNIAKNWDKRLKKKVKKARMR